MPTNSQLEPTVFVIFGGAGDLTWRKLIPALFTLFQSRSMPAHFSIIAVDRVERNDDTLHSRLQKGVKQFSQCAEINAQAWQDFAQHIRYLQGDFKAPQTYAALGAQCTKLEKEWDAKAQRIFYLATPRRCLAASRHASSKRDWCMTGNGRGWSLRNQSGMI
jgi:glucose-6-phosphate 1-dehydrogenase